MVEILISSVSQALKQVPVCKETVGFISDAAAMIKSAKTMPSNEAVIKVRDARNLIDSAWNAIA